MLKKLISGKYIKKNVGVHVRKPVDHLVTTSAHRTCRTNTNTFPLYSYPVPTNKDNQNKYTTQKAQK